MKKKKLPKRKPSDPRGGFLKIYSEKWLNDKNSLYDAQGDALDELQAGLIRLLCAVNEIDFQTGQFHTNGYALPRTFIESLAKIKPLTLDKLVSINKVNIDENGIYSLVDWEEFQDKKRLYGNSHRDNDAPHDAHTDAPVAPMVTALRKEEGNKDRKEEDKNRIKKDLKGDLSKVPMPLQLLWKEESSIRAMLQDPKYGTDQIAGIKANLNLCLLKQKQYKNKDFQLLKDFID